MASLKDIRRRIGSVKNTQQITKAMKMVAASRLRRAQMAISAARPFAEKLEAMTGRILLELQQSAGTTGAGGSASLAGLHPLLSMNSARRESDPNSRHRIALLVVASDRGLCGAYNSNAIRFAYRKYKELSDAGNDIQLFFVGRKGAEAFGRRGLKGHWFSDFWQGKFNMATSDKIAREFTQKFLNDEFDAIQVVYTQFKSAITQIVQIKQVLPLDASAAALVDDNTPAGEYTAPFIYEPGRKDILGTLLPTLVRTQFYRIFADSMASEFGSKMTAMDNASRNAGEMISKLSIEANRVRQAGITKELMEIVGGAEALKG